MNGPPDLFSWVVELQADIINPSLMSYVLYLPKLYQLGTKCPSTWAYGSHFTSKPQHTTTSGSWLDICQGNMVNWVERDQRYIEVLRWVTKVTLFETSKSYICKLHTLLIDMHNTASIPTELCEKISLASLAPLILICTLSWETKEHVLVFFPVVIIKNIDKNHWKKKTFILAYTSSYTLAGKSR